MTDKAELIYERLLVVRAQAGDEAAFGEIVERYSPRLRYFLRKLLVSSDATEEQELERFRSVRDDIDARVRTLVDEITERRPSSAA